MPRFLYIAAGIAGILLLILIIAVVVLLAILYIYRNQFSMFTRTIFGITDDINSSIPPVNTILG